MSWTPALEPGSPNATGIDAIETLTIPRARDQGGFEVRRVLPASHRQMVGPFIFFDQAGPAEFITGREVGVRPHPHIHRGTWGEGLLDLSPDDRAEFILLPS